MSCCCPQTSIDCDAASAAGLLQLFVYTLCLDLGAAAVAGRERRGWMGDAQASADEANLNYDMQAFYSEFLNKIRDDQLRYDGTHPTDKGALADVVPFDGIGGNPGCPVRDH